MTELTVIVIELSSLMVAFDSNPVTGVALIDQTIDKASLFDLSVALITTSS